MTVDEVKARVQEIRDIAWDDEVAHSKRDDLWENVLRAYAEGGVSVSLASEALKTEDIDFARWCA